MGRVDGRQLRSRVWSGAGHPFSKTATHPLGRRQLLSASEPLDRTELLFANEHLKSLSHIGSVIDSS